MKQQILAILASLVAIIPGIQADAQEARARAEMLDLIQREKFDVVLPGVMRDNGIDMWIHVIRDGNPDALALDLGGTAGYFIFTDRGGDRIERAVLAGRGQGMYTSGAYDIFAWNDWNAWYPNHNATELRQFIEERDPQRIAVNTSAWLAAADGLSHSGYQQLVEAIGETYASRLVSSENLITDFRVRRVQSEIVAFAQAGDMTRRILERALSREVITPGITTGEDVAWWVQERLLEAGLGSSFGLTRPIVIHSAVAEPQEYRSSTYAFQRGDLLQFDTGVKYLNFGTDMKRNAYLLREGETDLPEDIRHAWDEGRRARDIMRRNIRTGHTARDTLAVVVAALEAEGFVYTPFVNFGDIDRQIVESFDQPNVTGISIDCHVVGNTGNSQVAVGPSFAPFRELRADLMIQSNNIFSFEFITHTALPSFGNRRLRINFEDNVIVTNQGVELLYPRNERILLIR